MNTPKAENSFQPSPEKTLAVASPQAEEQQKAERLSKKNNGEVILEVKGLQTYFPIKGGMLQRVVGHVKAVDGISFQLRKGQTMGLVGESGCGKTTAGRSILRLTEKTGGEVLFRGQDIYKLSRKDMREMRTKMQIIFQDPYSSLSPRLPVGEIIGEAAREHQIVPKDQLDAYIEQIMVNCGLQSYHRDRYPHEFSGGQRQRICIARALALNPEFIVCDEPVSALDVSIQAQIINLLMDLQAQYDLTYLFISHDLSVVEHISDIIGVMYLGNMVEFGSKEDIFAQPLHPYTQALFSAIPIPDPDSKMNRILLEGTVPSPANPPKGCKFHTRCRHCMSICREVPPPVYEVAPGHRVCCHLYEGCPVIEDESLARVELGAHEHLREAVSEPVVAQTAAVAGEKSEHVELEQAELEDKQIVQAEEGRQEIQEEEVLQPDPSSAQPR